jgi:hypothetical protein
MTVRLYNPAVFQGSLRSKNYFEGWYFKHVSEDLEHVFAFIPGISLNVHEPHSFIQVINGRTGESAYVQYPLSSFTYSRNEMFVKIANSVFTDRYVSLELSDSVFRIKGRLDYSHNIRYPVRTLAPGIMGWYSFVPFMECKHGIVSANHNISGTLQVNDNLIDFSKGKGYIEKDWGTSFPESWLWIQANNFFDNETSFHFSVAKIPWLGKFFIGFISFLYYKRKFHIFSTYNNSRIIELKYTGNKINLVIGDKNLTLNILVEKNIVGELKAPVSGIMNRRIKESIDSGVSLTLMDRDRNEIYRDTSRRAGLEVIEKIFDYFDDGKEIQAN